MPKPHAYLQTMIKEPTKFQIDRYKSVWGVAHIKYPHPVPTICFQMPKSKNRSNFGDVNVAPPHRTPPNPTPPP